MFSIIIVFAIASYYLLSLCVSMSVFILELSAFLFVSVVSMLVPQLINFLLSFAIYTFIQVIRFSVYICSIYNYVWFFGSSIYICYIYSYTQIVYTFVYICYLDLCLNCQFFCFCLFFMVMFRLSTLLSGSVMSFTISGSSTFLSKIIIFMLMLKLLALPSTSTMFVAYLSRLLIFFNIFIINLNQSLN